MNVYSEILERLKKQKIHMTLIDPAKQAPEQSADIAQEAERAGTDYIMIGGSTEIDRNRMDQTIREIKKKCGRKIVIFPGSSAMISPHADAIYFMSLLNSRSPEFLFRHQVRAAPHLKKMGIETIPMGYLVFYPGMTVGKVGEADLLDGNDPVPAVSYSLAAEMMGMKLIYLESGSGSPSTVSPDVISAVKHETSVPIIVGGGIRDSETARKIAESGADIIVTGTIVEGCTDIYQRLMPIIKAVHSSNMNRF
ncbi:MAG: hypothetical protein AMDU1_APLC00009G0031 [Thermoplasmatales archaeon A-plasma]|nr:MAG: hypothetical protein AMDU1_APLC00009G0031 [Thermoplasmatales archaeon A-plasma]